MTCANIAAHDEKVIGKSHSSPDGGNPFEGQLRVLRRAAIPHRKISPRGCPSKGFFHWIVLCNALAVSSPPSYLIRGWIWWKSRGQYKALSACRHSIGTRQATESTVLVRANNVARAKRGDRVERGWVVTAILTEAMEVKSAQCRYPSCLSLEVGSAHSFTWVGGNHASKPANSSRSGVKGVGFEV